MYLLESKERTSLSSRSSHTEGSATCLAQERSALVNTRVFALNTSPSSDFRISEVPDFQKLLP